MLLPIKSPFSESKKRKSKIIEHFSSLKSYRAPCPDLDSNNQVKQSYLKVVHAVRERDHKARVIVDGLVTENDINSMVKIPEIVLCCGQLTAVVLWVVPVWV